jgi:hypothetical protein
MSESSREFHGFKPGDRVRYTGGAYLSAPAGATATVCDPARYEGGYLSLAWDRETSRGQMDGGYSPEDFALVGRGGTLPGSLPTDAAARKAIPLASGCLDYFPDALIAIAELSRKGNDQHNPGQPLHWDRSKSGDEADADIRHFMERGKIDTDGVRHSTKHAWRALALLQKELEAAGAPMARGAK